MRPSTPIILGAMVLLACALLVSSFFRAPRWVTPEDRLTSPAALPSIPRTAVLEAKPNPVPDTGTIVATEENFAALFDELYDRKEVHFGRELELAGYVMHQDDVGPGTFLIGRELLWHCEEDMVFIGYLARQELNVHLPMEGAEIRVRGILEPAEYRHPETGRSFTVPVIRVGSIEPSPGIQRRVYPQ